MIPLVQYTNLNNESNERALVNELNLTEFHLMFQQGSTSGPFESLDSASEFFNSEPLFTFATVIETTVVIKKLTILGK